jgi:hypothetical protein
MHHQKQMRKVPGIDFNGHAIGQFDKRLRSGFRDLQHHIHVPRWAMNPNLVGTIDFRYGIDGFIEIAGAHIASLVPTISRHQRP